MRDLPRGDSIDPKSDRVHIVTCPHGGAGAARGSASTVVLPEAGEPSVDPGVSTYRFGGLTPSDGEPHDRQHVQRRTPPRARGSGSGPQASRHVHRLDGHARADALPVGDHRQRRRRGAGRCRASDRGDPPSRRLGRGARRRSWHPGRQGAQDRAARGRGDLHQAARRGKVRRWLVRRDRRPARRGRLGGQRALGPPRRRRRPLAVPARDVLPAWRTGCLRRRGARGGVRAALGTDPQGQARGEGEVRHPDPLLAGPADLHQGRRVRL